MLICIFVKDAGGISKIFSHFCSHEIGLAFPEVNSPRLMMKRSCWNFGERPFGTTWWPLLQLGIMEVL